MIEPGEAFPVSYGSGKTIDAVALNLRSKSRLVKLVGAIEKAEDKTAVFDTIEESLRICCPKITDEQIDKLDDLMAMEIISATLSGNRVSEAEEKKSE